MARSEAPRRVLVLRFSAVGDVAMAMGASYRVARANPGVHIIFVTRRRTAGICVNPPDNLEVVGIDLADYRGVSGMWRLFAELCRKYRFDAVADLHSVIRTHLLRVRARLALMPTAAVCKDRMGRRALTRSRRKRLVPLRSMHERYLDVFKALSLATDAPFRSIFADMPADPSLFAVASPAKLPGWRWVAVAPFARHKGKIYPVAMMERVVASLAAMEQTRVFLLGAGKHEDNVLGQWAMRYDNVVNMAQHSLGFAAELALMSFCDVVLSMDSANMHLASLAGTRVVSVWGATHPFAGFYGIGQDPADAVARDFPCRPCSVFGNKECRFGDYRCLRKIEPDEIVAMITAGS